MATPQNREIPMICPYHARVDDARPCVQVDRTTDRIRKRYSKSNPVHNMPDRNMPANHGTTTNPQNTKEHTNTSRPATGTPDTQSPESADQTANHTTTSEPVHADTHPTRSRQPRHHHKTAEYQCSACCTAIRRSRPPRSGPNLRTKSEIESRRPIQSTPTPDHQPRHHHETAEYQQSNTQRQSATIRRATQATRIHGPNRTMKAEKAIQSTTEDQPPSTGGRGHIGKPRISNEPTASSLSHTLSSVAHAD